MKCFSFFLALLALSLIGCGGGGGSASTNPPPVSSEGMGTRFDVDVMTGKVRVTPLVPTASGQVQHHAILLGTAVSFTATDVVNLADNLGVKATKISFSNPNSFKIGVQPNGIETPVHVYCSAISVTGGSGEVKVSNPDGFIASSGLSSTPQPYMDYTGVYAQGQSSPAKQWNFLVPNNVTAFTFTLWLQADTDIELPPNYGTGASGNRVQVRTLAGGKEGFTDGTGAAARFLSPTGIAADASGTCYVTDRNAYAIRMVEIDGRVSTIAGDPTHQGYQDGSGNQAQLSSNIAGIWTNKAGDTLLFCDRTRIRMAKLNGGDKRNSSNWQVSTLAGTAVLGNDNGPGVSATFNFLSGIVANEALTTIYVAENNGNRIRKAIFLGGDRASNNAWSISAFAGDNSAVAGIAGTTDGNGTSARFSQPQFLAMDRVGAVYVTEIQNSRIRKVTPEGQVTTLAGGVSGDVPTLGYTDGPGATAQFGAPSGIAVDSAGFLFVTDFVTGNVRMVNPSGRVSTILKFNGNVPKDGSGAVASLYFPAGLALTSGGKLIVTDLAGDFAVRVLERYTFTAVDGVP